MSERLYYKYVCRNSIGYHSIFTSQGCQLYYALNERTEAPGDSYIFLYDSPLKYSPLYGTALLACKVEGLLPRRQTPRRIPVFYTEAQSIIKDFWARNWIDVPMEYQTIGPQLTGVYVKTVPLADNIRLAKAITPIEII